MMTEVGEKRRRTPGGVFFKLVKEHVAATDKKLFGRIFGLPKKKAAASNGKTKQPAVDPLTWPMHSNTPMHY